MPRRPRRPFGRRPRPGPPRARQLNPRQQRELRRANHLLSTGEHANAAEILSNLGEIALDLGIQGPAPMLLLRAAHALLLGALIEPSTQRAYQALGLLADAGRWPALRRESDRYIEALEGEGYAEQAAAMRQWIDEEFKPELPALPASKDAEQPAQLPENCPYCGASMSLEQVNTRGARAAECHYCGSVVLPSQIE